MEGFKIKVCECMKNLMFVLLVFLLMGCQQKMSYYHNQGMVFGTTYNFVYSAHADLHQAILAKVDEVNLSLSTYNPQSIISRVNQNDTTVVVDAHFEMVFNRAKDVYNITGGAFDLTVAPLVNTWGFGFGKKETVTPELIDSLMVFVGMSKVNLLNRRVVKDDPRLMLDAGAIAKGYGVDVAAKSLDSLGVVNYMIEIGGEVRVKGSNPKGLPWRIGVDKPIDDPTVQHRELETIIHLNNQSLATSGNYRNFYYDGDMKRSHTISPQTGYPAQSNMLSATVLAADCTTADAYATAFMVLGVEKSLTIVNNDSHLEAFFIYVDTDGITKTVATNGFK
jgi:FAD:protein FMN transferase